MTTAQVFEVAGQMSATAFFQALAIAVFEVEDGATDEATDIFGDAVADAAEGEATSLDFGMLMELELS